MFLLNLTLGQFLMLFGTTSAFVVALYLLDRSRRRQVVATLRFWAASQRPAETRRRRRIQQPLSLVLQLIGIALLLLALGQLRLGSRGPASRDHVLILDTGAWMAARSGANTLMEQARALARAYVRALPARDRVMVVRADALATPATVFESNRQAIERAIAESQPAATALYLEQALAFAAQAQKLGGGTSGEIVYVGPGHVLGDEAEGPIRVPPNFRVLPVAGAVENCGLRKIGLRRSEADPAVWEIFVSARNYGQAPHTVTLAVQFGGSPVGSRELALAPGAEQSATFQLRTRAAGWLEARLIGGDAFPGDDRAVLELPQLRLVKVLVYSDQPELVRPALAANPWVRAEYRRTAEYDAAAPAEIVILDGFRPAAAPRSDAIWIDPPLEGSPVAIRGRVTDAALARWRADTPLAAGIRGQDLRLEQASIYSPAPGDVSVAEVEGGPVIVARDGKPKLVALGFHPGRSAMRYELAAPLLFANILRWMAPEIFRHWEANVGSAGTVTAELESGTRTENVRVVGENGMPVPHTLQERSLRFFAANPGTVRILTGDSELVYSLSLPQVAEGRWHPPAQAKRGLPRAGEAEPAYMELWPWLALSGGLVLLAEWLLFGRYRAAPVARLRAGGGRRNGKVSWLSRAARDLRWRRRAPVRVPEVRR